MGFLAVPLLKLGRVLDETRRTVKDLTDETVPLLDEVTTTVGHTNNQLEKVDTITTSRRDQRQRRAGGDERLRADRRCSPPRSARR